MNTTDALRFFDQCGEKNIVPYHMGWFDELTPKILDVIERRELNICKGKQVI
jgi:hypothetical protein